jgi:hypothetical protein
VNNLGWLQGVACVSLFTHQIYYWLLLLFLYANETDYCVVYGFVACRYGCGFAFWFPI